MILPVNQFPFQSTFLTFCLELSHSQVVIVYRKEGIHQKLLVVSLNA